jgi:hypothetical protein
MVQYTKKLVYDAELTHVVLSDMINEIKRRCDDDSVYLGYVETAELIDVIESRGYDVYSSDVDPRDELSDGELQEELESRGYHINTDEEDDALSLLHELYEMKSSNDPRFDNAFADMIYKATGRIL